MDGSGAGVREAALVAGAKKHEARSINIPVAGAIRDQFDLRELFGMLKRRRGIILGTMMVLTSPRILHTGPIDDAPRSPPRMVESRPT